MAAGQVVSLNVVSKFGPALQGAEEPLHQSVCPPQHQGLGPDLPPGPQILLVQRQIHRLPRPVLLTDGVDGFHVVVPQILVVDVLGKCLG